MKSLIDDFVRQHVAAESEQIHLLTTLYGIIIGDAIGRYTEAHTRIAKGLELLKTSTLIIDDFIDRTPRRDHILSFPEKYGNEGSVLIAEIIRSSASISVYEAIHALPWLTCKEKASCVLLVEDVYRTICSGQLDEIRFLSNPKGSWRLREQQYWDMIYKTTACFIQLPLLIAAIIMRVPPPRKIALARYGRFLGLAYQVRDDIIDLIGDPRITGKVKGSDFVEGKSRLPLIYYMKVSSPAQRSSMNALIRKKNRTKEDIDRAISLLLKSDAIRMAKSALARLCRKAAKEAGKCGGDLVTQQLIDVAGMLSLDN